MQEIFGDKIKNPLSDTFQSYGDVGQEGMGLVLFISNIIKMLTIVAGIWVIFNLIIAGFTYVTSGDDPKATAQAWAKIYMSLIGLTLMAGTFIIASIISYILFGDTQTILNPTIYGPGV